jgi:Tannase and feruloyl esterase
VVRRSAPPAASIQFYEAVAAKMGGVPQTQSFYRIFMAPGMQHCGGGAGPNAFGGPFACRPMHDAAHDVFNAVSAVETASVLAVNVLLRHRRQSAFAARRA